MLVILGMLALFPATLWIATGSARRAWRGFREYLIAISVIVIPPLLIAAGTWLHILIK